MADEHGEQNPFEAEQTQKPKEQESTIAAKAEQHAETMGTVAGAQGGNQNSNPAPPLQIATIGDIFIERFIWSDSESTALNGQLPYTAPDDLRAHNFTNTFVELSGSPLHAEIYRTFLTECGFVGKNPESEKDVGSEPVLPSAEEVVPGAEQAIAGAETAAASSEAVADFEIVPVPGPKEITQLANDLLSTGGDDHSFRNFFASSFSLDASFGPFPIYLHELSAFPADHDSTNKKKRVWRINNSHGEIRAPEPSQQIIDRVNTAIGALHNEIGKWLFKRVAAPMPSVVVICDRNADKHTMRGRPEAGASARSAFTKILKQYLKNNPNGKPGDLVNPNEQDLLLIWHTRSPLFPVEENHGGALGKFFLEKHVAMRTIAIVSDRCLREEGVKLRFDVSYETTLQDLITASKTNPVIKKLMKFPHALIRFDYGIVHMTSVGGTAVAVDLHAVASGNRLSAATKQGVVQGLTPLLVGAILREVVNSCVKHGGAADGVRRFLEQINRSVHPTALHNTPLDRAIDSALILWNLHFKQGYTDATGDNWFANTEKPKPETLTANLKSDTLFRNLVRQVAKAVPSLNKQFTPVTEACKKTLEQLAKTPSAEDVDEGEERHAMAAMAEYLNEAKSKASGDGDWLEDYVIVTDDSRLERLSRLSRPLNGKTFSRAQLLRNRGVMVGAAGVPHLGPEGKNSAAREEMRQRVLLRIVERGLEYVLQRPEMKVELNGKNVLYRFEPSVVVPNLQFGKMATIDPEDINSFLAVRNLVDKYLAADGWKNPLAIAVFGKPGSGKSTIVKKILGDVPNCELDPSLECNLSQWTSLDRLSLHFQKIQDRTLHTQKAQIVFFDEFDSPLGNEPVGWLKYFLMPLQDGMYMVGNDTFHFGKSIFVFAGGIAEDYDDFLNKFRQQPNAKVLDFVSRLRAHIDVKDISLSDGFVAGLRASSEDHAAQIRRAILLREILKSHMKSIFDRSESIADVSPELVYAFLNISGFTHGVRSMQAIVQMSLVSSRNRSFKSWSLPTEQQLQLHVDQVEFMKLVRTMPSGLRKSPGA